MRCHPGVATIASNKTPIQHDMQIMVVNRYEFKRGEQCQHLVAKFRVTYNPADNARTLSTADLQQLQIQKPHFTYDGDGQVLTRVVSVFAPSASMRITGT